MLLVLRWSVIITVTQGPRLRQRHGPRQESAEKALSSTSSTRTAGLALRTAPRTARASASATGRGSGNAGPCPSLRGGPRAPGRRAKGHRPRV
eukprot:3163689-Pyramimonas_sp.AAC.1